MTAARPTPAETTDLDALAALAQREQQAGRLPEAAAVCRQILALRPHLAEVHDYLGIILAQQGQAEEARARFEHALVLKPNYADAHNDLADLLFHHGHLAEAGTHYRQALALEPGRPEAHNNFGIVLAQQGQLDEAVAQFEQAIALEPAYAEALNNLGNIFWKQGELVQAEARYRQAIALRPDYADAHANLGNVLARQGHLDQAAAECSQALALKPDYSEAHKTLADVLLSQGRLDEAADCYRQALALWPDYADAHLGLATCHLAQGDYERGWAANEWRLRVPGLVPQPGLPLWTGQALAGRSLLLVAEQGLGDTLHFIRYARVFKERGLPRVVLACQAALAPLLTTGSDVDEIFVLGSSPEWPRADFYLPLLSTPRALGTTAATIPADVPYLRADPQLSAQWRGELAGISGLRVGIVWQGSRGYFSDPWRSIPLAEFAPLAHVSGVQLISLQKGFGSEQLAAVDFPLVDLGSRLDEQTGPFQDTAAVIGNLDLVVAPNTAVAHLAGALAAPVWVGLHFSPDWRWLAGRDDTPWYPTMRIFRQSTFGQWSDVIERMAAALPALVARRA